MDLYFFKRNFAKVNLTPSAGIRIRLTVAYIYTIRSTYYDTKPNRAKKTVLRQSPK